MSRRLGWLFPRKHRRRAGILQVGAGCRLCRWRTHVDPHRTLLTWTLVLDGILIATDGLKWGDATVLMRYILPVSILLSLSACQHRDSTVEPSTGPEGALVDQEQRASEVADYVGQAECLAQLDANEPQFGIVHPDGTITVRDRDRTIIAQCRGSLETPLAGEWVERDGSRFCNGYMTRVESEEFCVSEIPDGWVPFKFEGQTYFVQPLASAIER